MAASTGKKGILKWFLIAAVLVVILLVALPFVVDANQFRPQLESKLSAALGRDVKFGKIKLSVLSGSVLVEDIHISDDPSFSQSPFVNARSLRASVELKPLIFDKIVRIQEIRLERPAITLVSTPSGQWNFSNLGSGSAGRKPSAAGKSAGLPGTGMSVKKLEIVDGQVTIVHSGQQRKASVYNGVNIEVRDLSYTTAFPFSLKASLPGEGTLKLEGQAGPLNTQDMTLTPLQTALEVKHFDLRSSGFSSSDSGLSGIFDFSGTVQSDGTRVRSKGSAAADKLQIVNNGSPANRPIHIQYELDYNLIKRSGNLGDSTVEIGKAAARLKGNYELLDGKFYLRMVLRGTDMPVEDLEALFPAFAITLPKGASLKGGVLNTNLSAEGPVDRLQIAGQVDLDKTRLTGFDLSGRLAALSALTGLRPNQDTEIEKFASVIKLTPEGTQVSNLLLIVPAIGELSGDGRIAADQSLDFTMKAMLKPGGTIGSGLMQLVKRDNLNIPFFVRGTASNPKFTPDMKKAAGGLLGSVIGQGNEGAKPTGGGNALQDTLRGLFKKK